MDVELITDVITKVFPAGLELLWKADKVGQKDRFWIIPGKEGPRWIVPQNTRCGWTVLKQWRPYDLSSRLKWAALMAAYRTGQLGLVPDVVGVGVLGVRDRSWSHLGWKSDSMPVPVIYAGTPGPTRKAVAHLVNASTCKPVAVTKVPLGVRSVRNILHEADILKSLEEEKPGMGPRVRYVDRTAGISLQDFIGGRSSSRSLTQAHIDWLAGLCRSGIVTSLKEQSEMLMKRLAQLEGLEEETHHLLKNLLEKLDDPTPLPAFWVHGDFAPWNLRWVEKGKLVAVDWEEARMSGLPGTDLIYFHVIQDFLFCSNAPDKTWQRLQEFVNSRLARSYIESFWHVEKILTSLVLFTLVELLIKRSLIVNVTSDQFCRYLQNLVQESIENL